MRHLRALTRGFGFFAVSRVDWVEAGKGAGDGDTRRRVHTNLFASLNRLGLAGSIYVQAEAIDRARSNPGRWRRLPVQLSRWRREPRSRRSSGAYRRAGFSRARGEVRGEPGDLAGFESVLPTLWAWGGLIGVVVSEQCSISRALRGRLAGRGLDRPGPPARQSSKYLKSPAGPFAPGGFFVGVGSSGRVFPESVIQTAAEIRGVRAPTVQGGGCMVGRVAIVRPGFRRVMPEPVTRRPRLTPRARAADRNEPWAGGISRTVRAGG